MKNLIPITLTIIFSLSMFAATGFSQLDCGEVCCCSSNIQGMQHPLKYQARIDSGCCSQAPTHPCGLTKHQNLELPMCALAAGRINSGASVGAFVHPIGSAYDSALILSQNPWPVAKFSIQSPPIYLQHLSLLIWSFPQSGISAFNRSNWPKTYDRCSLGTPGSCLFLAFRQSHNFLESRKF